ncbi:MAG: hypothetical protein U9Q76_09560 [candidate division WOR-3 bacterium]|nr:hypothetical protein [candidate division WOR-3 bacterium]
MKKIVIVLPLAILIVSCGLFPKPPDVEGIEKLLTEELKIVVTPDDDSVTIEIKGFPAELPEGLEGVSVYLGPDTMGGVPGSELGVPIASGITHDTTLEQGGLENGKQYYFEGRGEMAGDTVSTLGFGGMFYPRPWGQGSYLGHGPGTPPEEGKDNAFILNRETGKPTSMSADSTADFFFFTDAQGENLYITSGAVLAVGEIEKNGIADAHTYIDSWFKVQNAPEAYVDTMLIEKGKVYHFKIADDYYGKFAVEGIDVVPALTLGEGDALRVWLRYAFQTAQHIGHY